MQNPNGMHKRIDTVYVNEMRIELQFFIRLLLFAFIAFHCYNNMFVCNAREPVKFHTCVYVNKCLYEKYKQIQSTSSNANENGKEKEESQQRRMNKKYRKKYNTNRNHCVWTVEFAWLKLFIQTTVSFINNACDGWMVIESMYEQKEKKITTTYSSAAAHERLVIVFENNKKWLNSERFTVDEAELLMHSVNQAKPKHKYPILFIGHYSFSGGIWCIARVLVIRRAPNICIDKSFSIHLMCFVWCVYVAVKRDASATWINENRIRDTPSWTAIWFSVCERHTAHDLLSDASLWINAKNRMHEIEVFRMFVKTQPWIDVFETREMSSVETSNAHSDRK